MENFQITDNLSLQLIQQKHAADIFALIEKNQAHLREFMPWLDNNTDLRHTMQFIDAMLKQYESSGAFQCVIIYKQEVVGLCGYHALDKANRSTSLGYWLDQNHAGKGIMTAAIKTLTEHAFNKLNINRIEIHCATTNIASQRVAEKSGYKKEATLKQKEWLYDHFVDHHIYSQFPPKK